MGQLKYLFLIALIAVGASGARAQETFSPNRLTTDHQFDPERISDVQISPDGARIVYKRQQVNRLEDKGEPSIWIVNADGSQNRFLAKGGAAKWSPDSRRLLDKAEAEPGQTQIFVRWIGVEGPATQVTHAT